MTMTVLRPYWTSGPPPGMLRLMRPNLSGADPVGRGLFFLVMLVALGAPALARAQANDERARQLFEEGRSFFDQGNYSQCILTWREAYRLSQRAGLLFNLAEAEERAERFGDAAGSLERYLASGEAHARENRSSITQRVARLREQAASSPVPPPLVAQAPPPQLVQPAPAPPPVAETPAPTRPRIWSWVALGLTGAFVIGTVVTGVLTLNLRSELEDACGGTSCPASRQSDWDTARSLAITTDVLIGLASASAAATVLLFLLETRPRTRSTAMVIPWAGAGSWGLISTFSF